MDSSQDTSLIRRLGRLIGRTVLTAAAVALSVYATRRRPDPEEGREASADEPAEQTEGSAVETTEEEPIAGEAPAEGEAKEPHADAAEESGESTDEVAKDESVVEEAPAEGEADESVREVAAEDPVAEEVRAGGESEESAGEARPLDELTADELYPLAQRLDIVGRATMDQAQLVEALQAEGIREVAQGEPVTDEVPAGSESEESEESAGEARPLDELTADELYPLAQRLDIVGRATMDQAQLVEALQAEGIREVAQGEPVAEEAPDEGETEEHADEIAETGDATSTEQPAVDEGQEPIAVRPLDELTAEELYRLAQRLDIAGRSTMRKAQLVEALKAEGIDEAEV